jgi:TetR/AcrR family transcriptional repressor of nem operon
VGCQTHIAISVAWVGDEAVQQAALTTLTPKGERTRARIVGAASSLIYERGVAGTQLTAVRKLANVSGSQLSHYFTDKAELVQAVIDWQATLIVEATRRADLGNTEGLRAWRDMVIAAAQRTGSKGGCPLGSLASQLAENDATARGQVAVGFERWLAALEAGMKTLDASGHLRPGIDPVDLAVTLLAALQGGLLLAQTQRNELPLKTAIDTVLALAIVDR